MLKHARAAFALTIALLVGAAGSPIMSVAADGNNDQVVTETTEEEVVTEETEQADQAETVSDDTTDGTANGDGTNYDGEDGYGYYCDENFYVVGPTKDLPAEHYVDHGVAVAACDAAKADADADADDADADADADDADADADADDADADADADDADADADADDADQTNTNEETNNDENNDDEDVADQPRDCGEGQFDDGNRCRAITCPSPVTATITQEGGSITIPRSTVIRGPLGHTCRVATIDITNTSASGPVTCTVNAVAANNASERDGTDFAFNGDGGSATMSNVESANGVAPLTVTHQDWLNIDAVLRAAMVMSGGTTLTFDCESQVISYGIDVEASAKCATDGYGRFTGDVDLSGSFTNDEEYPLNWYHSNPVWLDVNGKELGTVDEELFPNVTIAVGESRSWEWSGPAPEGAVAFLFWNHFDAPDGSSVALNVWADAPAQLPDCPVTPDAPGVNSECVVNDLGNNTGMTESVVTIAEGLVLQTQDNDEWFDVTERTFTHNDDFVVRAFDPESGIASDEVTVKAEDCEVPEDPDVPGVSSECVEDANGNNTGMTESVVTVPEGTNLQVLDGDEWVDSSEETFIHDGDFSIRVMDPETGLTSETVIVEALTCAVPNQPDNPDHTSECVVDNNGNNTGITRTTFEVPEDLELQIKEDNTWTTTDERVFDHDVAVDFRILDPETDLTSAVTTVQPQDCPVPEQPEPPQASSQCVTDADEDTEATKSVVSVPEGMTLQQLVDDEWVDVEAREFIHTDDLQFRILDPNTELVSDEFTVEALDCSPENPDMGDVIDDFVEATGGNPIVSAIAFAIFVILLALLGMHMVNGRRLTAARVRS